MGLSLKLAHEFGPFSELETGEIPEFAVFTGLNGSGKTQLLRAIANGNVAVHISGNEVKSNQILYVGPQLTPRLNLTYLREDVYKTEQSLIQVSSDYRDRWHKRGRPLNKAEVKKIEPLSRIASILGKSNKTLLREEVEAFAVAVNAEDKSSHFSTDLAHVSMGHLRKFYYWRRALAVQAIGDRSLDDLIDKIGDMKDRLAPWDLVSQILSPFGFKIEGPECSIESAQNDLKLKLINRSEQEVPPDQLSGGEQSLLALAIAQYTSSLGSSGFPKLLLLDESLSSLHPSIIRRAISTINEVFINQLGIHVVVVTHAATLVALAPEDSLFQVKSVGSRLEVKKTSIDTGIGILTTGIPTMRVDSKNRRQVLVEANQDEFIYPRAYQALREHLDPEVSLEFLSWNKKVGTNSKVLDLVPRLRSAGVPTVYGIVDWDNSSRSLPDGVFALGEGERYAIENVFLDPLILSFMLARSEKGRTIINVESSTKLLSLEKEQLQSVVDLTILKIREQMTEDIQIDEELTEVEYVGGHCLMLPKWTLMMRGHDYAEHVVQAFPFLKSNREGPNGSPTDQLIAAIVGNHLVDAVEFIPKCLLSLFKRIQTSSLQEGTSAPLS